jgi:hypothetical protein
VATPVMADCPSWIRRCVASIASIARIIGSEMRFSVSAVVPCAAPKISDCALSR